MNIDEIKSDIEKYKKYLNNGQFKPDWRIDEVQNYINIMEKVIKNNGTD